LGEWLAEKRKTGDDFQNSCIGIGIINIAPNNSHLLEKSLKPITTFPPFRQTHELLKPQELLITRKN